MNYRSRPQFCSKDSIQTLQQGLEEYYQLNPKITDPICSCCRNCYQKL